MPAALKRLYEEVAALPDHRRYGRVAAVMGMLVELAGDLPVDTPDEGLIPEYRVRGAVTWRF